MEKAGIPGNFSNNSLRATTASRVYASKVDEQLITEQTGHRSNAVHHYKRSNIDQKVEVSRLLHGLPAKRQKTVDFESVSTCNEAQNKENEVIDITEDTVKKPDSVKSAESLQKVIQNLNISDIIGNSDSKSSLIEFHFHIHNK